MASKKTKVVTIRLPVEIHEKIQKRIANNPTYKTTSDYLRGRIIYDVTRKHKRSRPK